MSASVFPAYVGMSPEQRNLRRIPAGVPRIRGDEPQFTILAEERLACSPHTWG